MEKHINIQNPLGSDLYHFNADVEPGVSIRIHGTDSNNKDFTPVPFNKLFKISDRCARGSYSLIFNGVILKITRKTVIVQRGGEQCYVSLPEFIMENYKFDADKVDAFNAEELLCI